MNDGVAVAARSGGSAAKRIVDITLGTAVCIVALPIVLLLALVLYIEHRAMPFFVHDRIGTGGRLLAMPKLRTLAPEHDPYADKVLQGITPSSRFTSLLRRTHLDELPQLYLVPLGQMSLVGPRPRMAAEASQFGSSRYDRERVTVPQGCTGLWQISTAGHSRVSDNPEYDLFYLEHRSLRLDAWILWRTVVQALGARRIDLDDVPGWALRRPGARFEEASAPLDRS